MYARTFTATFQAGKMDEVIRLVEESILPAAQQQPGFHHLYFLTDLGANKGTIISLWATEADRSAGENNGFLREQVAKLGELVAAPPSVDRFAVSSHG